MLSSRSERSRATRFFGSGMDVLLKFDSGLCFPALLLLAAFCARERWQFFLLEKRAAAKTNTGTPKALPLP